MVGARKGRSAGQAQPLPADLEKQLAADRQILASAAEMAEAISADLPSERELLAMLKATGYVSDHVDHTVAELDKRDRSKARTDLAARRREQVRAMSLQGVPVKEISETLGITYDYVVQLRADLRVPRRRIGR